MNLFNQLPAFISVLLFLLLSPLGILFSICAIGITIENGAFEGSLFYLAGFISIILLNILALMMVFELKE